MHACFISYRHPARTGGREEKVLQHTLTALKDHIELYTHNYDVYYDKDRLIPGYQYDERLAQAICQSACMVLIYWPSYLEFDYCMKEVSTMLDIEKARCKLLGSRLHGSRLFVPVLLRSEYDNLPSAVREGSQYLDYSRQSTNPNFNIGDEPEMSEKLFQVAQYIKSLCDVMKSAEVQLFAGCENYVFPVLPSGASNLAALETPQAFPGR